MNGPPTEREFNELKDRVAEQEKDIVKIKEEHARMRGIASILGLVGGLVAGAIVTTIFRAIFGG